MIQPLSLFLHSLCDVLTPIIPPSNIPSAILVSSFKAPKFLVSLALHKTSLLLLIDVRVWYTSYKETSLSLCYLNRFLLLSGMHLTYEVVMTSSHCEKHSRKTAEATALDSHSNVSVFACTHDTWRASCDKWKRNCSGECCCDFLTTQKHFSFHKYTV